MTWQARKPIPEEEVYNVSFFLTSKYSVLLKVLSLVISRYTSVNRKTIISNLAKTKLLLLSFEINGIM